MKKIISLFLIALAFTSCDNDKDQKIDPSQLPAPEVQSVSVTEDATVPSALDSIIVTYDADVTFNPLSEVTISRGEILSTKILKERDLVIYVNLAPDKDYTISIPEDYVIGYDSKKWAPAYSFTFKTENVGEYLTKSLTNPKATAEAQKVYDLLVANYGSKQFSGAMGEVAWGTGFCDMIYNASGKYPAIAGFDYIHLASSPSNWIDYGDITPVKKMWEAGSIPAMTWHWNVPTSEDSSDVTYNASSDKFKASNVLEEGTWENKVAVADVEKLAGYLKILQDAGIPVLWRPFHEAAGDYTWGHWFWWGNSGVETTKELWKWLHNKLTNEYGLNNLIWVWTVQTRDAGNLAPISKLREAYPGDDVVDIVGTDLYEEAMSDQTPQFNLVYKLVEGKKLVALTECGNLLDVDSAYANGALWSYFMGWYETDESGNPAFNQWNTNGEWKTVLNNPLVLNQGDFSLK